MENRIPLKPIPFFSQRRTVVACFLIVGCSAFAAANKHVVSQTPADNVVGKPWIGAGGVQRTTAGIMADPAIVRTTSFATRPKVRLPDRKHLPQDSRALSIATWPQLDSPRLGRVTPVTSAPQTVTTNFDAATGDATNGPFPPDTMGAVGPTQFFLFINGRLKTFNKTTGVADGVINANPDAFFSSVMTPAVAANATSNPQIRYDRLTSRWILTIIDTPGTSAGDFGQSAEQNFDRSLRCS